MIQILLNRDGETKIYIKFPLFNSAAKNGKSNKRSSVLNFPFYPIDRLTDYSRNVYLLSSRKTALRFGW